MADQDNLKPYCERMAKAMPERFKLTQFPDKEKLWFYCDKTKTYCKLDVNGTVWQFCGPLADEFGITKVIASGKCPKCGYHQNAFCQYHIDVPNPSFLEALVIAVTEAVEAKAKEMQRA